MEGEENYLKNSGTCFISIFDHMIRERISHHCHRLKYYRAVNIEVRVSWRHSPLLVGGGDVEVKEGHREKWEAGTEICLIGCLPYQEPHRNTDFQEIAQRRKDSWGPKSEEDEAYDNRTVLWGQKMEARGPSPPTSCMTLEKPLNITELQQHICSRKIITSLLAYWRHERKCEELMCVRILCKTVM